ncbi:MAG: phage tail protein, partial [Phascolarctobacterium sp.]
MSIFKGTNTTTRAEKISSFTVATAEYGESVPEILGTTRISGNVIDYGDFTANEHRETQRSGKGGGSKTTTITYTYTVAIIFALCEGAIAGINRVWIDKDIYYYPNDAIQLKLFDGSENQAPWSYNLSKHPEKALSYPGLAYMAGVIDLGNNGSLPNFNFEVKGKLLETGDGIDVNPADYILYVMNRIGLGDIPIEGIENYRKYCREADLLISTPSDDLKAKAAREIINDIAELTNAFIFWSSDQFKIVPLDDRPVGEWQPNRTILYDLTPDDLLEQSDGACVSYSRKDSSELYNRFTVEFLNRSNAYEKESVSYEDRADIQAYGLKQASTINAHYIYKKSRAVFLAERAAWRNKYERNKYTFSLDWSYCRLEVGDLVTLTDPNIGLDRQVAIIDSVTEDSDGILTYTAISRAPGDYSAATFDVHENERPYTNFSPEPGDIEKPAVFQPPSELTSNGNELWIGCKGKLSSWGGCNVWVSDDNEHYREIGKITNTARIGALANTISKDSTVLEVSINDMLLSGSTTDAERGNTLCWIGGECLSYTTAIMLENGNYQLSGLVRGQYNTQAAAHAAGTMLVRCDAAIIKQELRKEDIGKKIYLKFTSYNIFGAREQSLADVEKYEYIITDYYIPPVTELTAYNRYRQINDGVSRYDIVVKWQPPELATYMTAHVWYKTSGEQIERAANLEGIAVEDIGFYGDWIYGGSGKDQAIIPQAIVGDRYLIAVTTQDEFGATTSPDSAPQTEILVAMKTTVPNMPDGFGITFGAQAMAYWDDVTNSDIVYYELRLDQQPGIENEMLLARTNANSITVTLPSRKGKLYLYAKSAIGKYSFPAELEYNKSEPPKPKAPAVTAKLGGMAIKAEPVPSGCKGVNYYINDVKLYSQNNIITYTCDAGIYDVQVSYVDIFGEGPLSDKSICVVEVKITNDMLEDEAITLSKVDANIKASLDKVETNAEGLLDLARNTNDNFLLINQSIDGINTIINSHDESISQLNLTASELSSTIVSNKNAQDTINQNMASSIQQTSQSITAIVTELGKSPDDCSYSAISQLQNNINLRVEKAKVISQINLSPETITIDGKLIHITGDTVFDDNVIIGKMLQAGCITTEKFAADAISLTGALSIIGGAVKLSEEGLRLTSNDNSYTLFNSDGINYVDKNGVVYAQVKKMIIGKAYDGQYIRFSAPWDSVPSVITVPMSIRTND